MGSDRIAPESVTALAPILTPHGRLVLEPADDAVALSSDLSDRLREAFARGSGHGLLQLGAAEVGTVLPSVFGYWSEFGVRYVSAVCGQQDLDTSRPHTIIGPPRFDEFERLFDAHGADQIPYIERLAEYWGELCGLSELASAWADRLIRVTRGGSQSR